MQTPSPIFLLAGRSRGKRDNQLLRAALACCAKSKPSIAYVGAASGDNLEFFGWIAGLLKAAGAGEVALVPLAGAKAGAKKTERIFAAADLVFVSGGDVEEGMRVLARTKADAILQRLHADGVPFVGVSAGSIMLGTHWIRWPDPNDDSSAETFPCLGLAPVACDTHAEGEQWEELRALVRLSEEGQIGYGIPSGGAMQVMPNGTVEALAEPCVRFALRNGRVSPLADLRPRDL